MFKKPKRVEGRQDVYGRKIFVVSPKDSFVNFLIEQNPDLERFKEPLYRPTVYLTPEVPYEESLEGYAFGLLRIIQREFLDHYKRADIYGLPKVPIPEFSSDDEEEVRHQFDHWWTIREANDYFEFLDQAWISS